MEGLCMYISKSKRPNGKYFISIAKGIRDPETKKSKKIQIKGFGTHDLDSKSGKKALVQAEAELKEMIRLDEASRGFENFEDFIVSMSKDKLSLKHKNIGYLPYLEIFNQLKLQSFFSKMVKDSKLDYSFSDMMFYQVLGRLFNPSSKLEVATRKDDFLYDFNFVNNDNIYSSLDVFSGFNKHKSKALQDGIQVINDMEILLDTVDSEAKKILETNINNTSHELEELITSYDSNFEMNENKLFKHLNKHMEKIVPERNISLAFYDCTTYYFESFDEDGFRERGMSKDNKRNETQVVMGLLIDTNGIPISYRLFKGNKHELHTMEEVIDDILNNYTIKEIIIVADRGLNSRANLEMIRGKGLNYIVGSKGSAVPKDLKEKKFNSSWNITSKAEAKYKSGYITSKRKVSHNDETYDELIIKKYSDVYKEREMFKQDKMLERAKKNIKDFTINSTTKSKSKYYKAVDNPKEKINIEIDEEKIKQEQENFGYFYIVTNKVEMNPADIMVAYKSLYKIEESFRILKTNLKARPVYHFKERRIRSHFLICYLALVIQRVLEYKLEEKNVEISTHEIINGLEGFVIDEIDYKVDKLYMISDKLFKSKINQDIFKIEKNVLLSNEISNIIKKM
ncbi:transposase, IS4 family protein [Alkaliphilus metalliredigens QYMF]|uniref:Transposase, IS4 family protein n=2 Tax=Alkaliphilus TaxID=114627 RepID=A6TKF9_ALKMQ|nr:transposase, IS4 family protein [Alkaliphilus metalliredigens QYMF]ABR47320.1 transposase, IS4 family protein [Alkaliphilus metalliredigens QYMF]ABR47452.1 transposase, IS4 family protein [Alkaliphilus metalliredigens QYMF]ABR49180.1 transposase, IS4 family protein [Alkaliphilus metalliredigens QYMF]ABR49937.1 transposase, IS4 family protein [Alkaliphilus metalliredigens QYMF]